MTYDRIALQKEIDRDEGNVPYAYQDHLGYWTIGRGYLIDQAKGGNLPDKVNDFWLGCILEEREKQLDQYIPWWRSLSDPRQRALLNMSYQLGVSGLLKFSRMLGCLQTGDWSGAYKNALDSNWAQQTPARAKRVAEQLL